MLNRKLYIIAITLVYACVMFFMISCKKTDTVKAVPWLSLNFAGSFGGNDMCIIAGSNADTINITAVGSNQVNISNLYGSGHVFYGTVSNDTCYITPQIYNNGKALMQGNFILSGDSIDLAIIVSTFGQEDKCNAVLVKR